MRNKFSFLKSLNNATNGLVTCFKTERNMRIHFAASAFVLILGLMFEFSKIEFILLLSAIVSVLFAEMINTALEYLIDASVKDFNPLVKICKDVAAGAVLLTAGYAVIVGYLLFYDRIVPLGNGFLSGLHQNPIHLTIIATGLTLLLVVALKSKFSKDRGSFFQGGRVSGHSAISFLLATIIGYTSKNLLVISLAYLLALLVAESRVEGKIHKPADTFYGALLGVAVGLMIFILFG